jgi:2-(1,2-epoxy-1,2-dihydrophenyl)acetyl-CoA isomerase
MCFNCVLTVFQQGFKPYSGPAIYPYQLRIGRHLKSTEIAALTKLAYTGNIRQSIIRSRFLNKRKSFDFLFLCLFPIGTMSSIVFEKKGSIAHIRLNRPDKYNAFNREMALSLQESLTACKAKDIRCVYITGNGKAFSAGQDLEEVVDPNGPKITSILAEHYNPVIRLIRKLEKPVVAAVNGVAAGAGANIALCCDVVVAAQSASFIQAFSKIGLIPDSGGTYFIPRLIGWAKASALMMLGDKLSASEAERMNMIYKVFPDETFALDSLAIAETLSQMPTKGLALTKLALNNSLINNYEDQLNDEEILQERAGKTADYGEGVAAFLEKRKPVFKGE